MKFAYWGLLVLAVAVGLFGYVGNITWLIFLAVGIVVVAAFANPKRQFLGSRKNP